MNIFLELNGNEWIEESYSGVETVRKELPTNQQPEIVITNIIDETEHNLIIPSDEETGEILKVWKYGNLAQGIPSNRQCERKIA